MKKDPYSPRSSFFAAHFSILPAYTPGNKFNEIAISCTCEVPVSIRPFQDGVVRNEHRQQSPSGWPQGIRIRDPWVKGLQAVLSFSCSYRSRYPTWNFYHLCEKYGCFRASSTLGRSSGFHCNNSRTNRNAHMFGNPIFRGSLFFI